MKFTDDELVALGMEANQIWYGRLATVEDSNFSQLSGSLQRGRASLLVRNLLEPSDDEKLFLEGIELASKQPPVLRSYLASESTFDLPVGIVSEIYKLSDDQFLIDVSLPEGLHEIEIADAPTVREFLGSAAATAFNEGIGIEDLVLFVILDQGELKQAQAISKGTVKSGRIRAESDQVTLVEIVESEQLDQQFLVPVLGEL